MVSGTENPVVVIKKFNFVEMRARKQDPYLGYPENRSNYWKYPRLLFITVVIRRLLPNLHIPLQLNQILTTLNCYQCYISLYNICLMKFQTQMKSMFWQK